MTLNKILASTAFVLLLGFLAFGLMRAYSPKPIFLQGQIEAQEYYISSKVPGRIENVMVSRGDNIKQGDLLYVINSPELKAKLMQAEGGRDAANAQLKAADSGARRQEIRAAKEQWKKAHAAGELAQTTYNRVNNLFNDGVLARQKRDEAFTQWQAAKYTEQAALAMYQMAKEGARSETKAAAAGQARMAEGAVNEVSAILEDSQMRSPKTAQVTDVLLHAGELVPSGFPVVSLIDMTDAWAVFQVREDELNNFTINQEIKVTIPALAGDYTFRVSYISVMGDFAIWRATESGRDFDMKTFSVELRPLKPIKDLRAGMSVLISEALK
ncbi:MAG: efflux RND transporter periplasmic adaptor subunit [Sinobacterium sp.]|nr:efflux RND transporter periplasmic adaptor subunit [Sinobacterium sp.]